MQRQFGKAAEIITSADALVICAGAGMGVDSGLPDFRGSQGFWKAYPALAEAKMDFTEVASPRTFERDPLLAWGFYGHRLQLYRESEPHAGFGILRKWSSTVPIGQWIFTSNVDGQFQKAGFSPDNINECHGSIHFLQCMNECDSGVWDASGFEPKLNLETCRLAGEFPKCPACGGMARPNIVMFGDWNWLDARNRGQRSREKSWFEKVSECCGNVVVVEVGAGTSIPTVRHFSHRISREFGARIIRINPRECQVPGSRDIGLSCGALEGLRGIDEFLTQFVDRNH